MGRIIMARHSVPGQYEWFRCDLRTSDRPARHSCRAFINVPVGSGSPSLESTVTANQLGSQNHALRSKRQHPAHTEHRHQVLSWIQGRVSEQLERGRHPQVRGDLRPVENLQTILVIETRAEATVIRSSPVGRNAKQIILPWLPSHSPTDGNLQQGTPVVRVSRTQERHVAIVDPERSRDIHPPAIRRSGVGDLIDLPEGTRNRSQAKLFDILR